MIDTSTLPGSIGVPLSNEFPELKGLYYTAKEAKDETPIYQELDDRLMQLETSTKLHVDELNSIESVTANLIVSVEAKEEVLLRIDWLKRLYEVKNLLPLVSSLKEAERLQTLLSPVQSCPLKTELLTELNRLCVSLPESPTELETVYDQVMDLAIEQVGEAFINLGKAGREHVVQQVIEKFGESVSVDSIHNATKALEQQVNRLAESGRVEELQLKLDSLPLTHYPNLSAERKRIVAERLLVEADWKGLASLDRMIRQLDATISAAEENNLLKTEENGAASSIDFSRLDGLSIKIR